MTSRLLSSYLKISGPKRKVADLRKLYHGYSYKWYSKSDVELPTKKG
jgi:hypothetical protein